MTDTVTRLMELVSTIEVSATAAAKTPDDGEDYWQHVQTCANARQALQDELTRLFTPLSDEQIDKACESLGFGALSWSVVARAVEKAHGIGGES